MRYLEVALGESGGKHVMLPMTLARVDGWRSEVRVNSIKAEHFQHVPTLSNPDEITLNEEERVVAFYGAGQLYADPERQEPFW